MAALQEQMNAPDLAADYEQLMAVTAEWEAASRRLDDLMNEWETLQLEMEQDG